MPPSPPTRAAIRRVRVSAARAREGVAAALLCALTLCLLASSASAETSAQPKPKAITDTLQAPIVPAKNPKPAPLLLQTRYTVRKQIESIEPVSWLERYGKVRVRKLKR